MAELILSIVLTVGLWGATAIYWHVLKKEIKK